MRFGVLLGASVCMGTAKREIRCPTAMWAHKKLTPGRNPFSEAWAESNERRAHDLAMAGSSGGRILLHFRCAGRAFRRGDWSKGLGFHKGILREALGLIGAAGAWVRQKIIKV